MIAAATCAAIGLACGSSSSSNGGGSGASLDCAWLASNNCWKTTVAAASGCLPGASGGSANPIGALSADGKTCTFTTGQVVTFDPPLVLPLPDQPLWNFTMTNNGQECFRFQQADRGDFSVGSSVGTTALSASTAIYSILCPDGSSYSTPSSSALGLLSCDAGAFGGLPGTEDSASSSSVSFGVLGASATGGAVSIFNCQR